MVRISPDMPEAFKVLPDTLHRDWTGCVLDVLASSQWLESTTLDHDQLLLPSVTITLSTEREVSKVRLSRLLETASRDGTVELPVSGLRGLRADLARFPDPAPVHGQTGKVPQAYKVSLPLEVSSYRRIGRVPRSCEVRSKHGRLISSMA